MLRLKTLGPNAHEVTDGTVSVFFSYATPVAAHVAGEGYYRTSTSHSVTTTRHINAYIGSKGGTAVKQEWLDGLAFGVVSGVAR